MERRWVVETYFPHSIDAGPGRMRPWELKSMHTICLTQVTEPADLPSTLLIPEEHDITTTDSLEHECEHVARVPQGHEDAHHRASDAPHQGQPHPEVPVGLWEDLDGQAQQRPDHHQQQAEATRGPVGPVQGLGQGLRVRL